MSSLGAPVLLAALQSVVEVGPDSGSRTLVGVVVILVVAAVILGIGQMMTSKPKG